MTIDLAVAEKVKQLRRAGLRPPERLTQQITQAGPAALRPLLALATEIDLLYEDKPECFGPIHALRLLGELPQIEIIDGLLQRYPTPMRYEDDELPKIWNSEVPQMIGRIGQPAVAPLQAIVGSDERPLSQRGAAMIALVYLTFTIPELRAPLVADLRARLAQTEDKMLASHIVGALGSLGLSEAYAEIMALYRQGRVDQAVMSPAVARQMLLSGNTKQQLECIQHPLYERYDLHGPFEEEQAS